MITFNLLAKQKRNCPSKERCCFVLYKLVLLLSKLTFWKRVKGANGVLKAWTYQVLAHLHFCNDLPHGLRF